MAAAAAAAAAAAEPPPSPPPPPPPLQAPLATPAPAGTPPNNSTPQKFTHFANSVAYGGVRRIATTIWSYVVAGALYFIVCPGVVVACVLAQFGCIFLSIAIFAGIIILYRKWFLSKSAELDEEVFLVTRIISAFLGAAIHLATTFYMGVFYNLSFVWLNIYALTGSAIVIGEVSGGVIACELAILLVITVVNGLCYRKRSKDLETGVQDEQGRQEMQNLSTDQEGADGVNEGEDGEPKELEDQETGTLTLDREEKNEREKQDDNGEKQEEKADEIEDQDDKGEQREEKAKKA